MPNRALPRAIVSRGAMAEAARRAVSAGGTVADLRADACGHGAGFVAAALTRAGARKALVDTADAARAVRAEGLEPVCDAESDIDTELLYGVAGGRPVLRFVGTVLSTKPLLTGEAVSYGYTYRAERDTRVALVTGGYAQGIVRALGNHAQVDIDGALRRIVGRIAMDVCVVDLDGASAEVGAEATFFGGAGAAGDQLAVWARETGMPPLELLAVAAQHAVRIEED